MKFKEFCKTHKKKLIGISLISALVIVLVAGVIFYCFRKSGGTNRDDIMGDRGGFPGAQLENMTAASGVTSIGISQISFEVENMTAELEVEEVYVASNEEVQEGDKLFKLTKESVETVRKELEQTRREAELAYRAGTIELEQSKIEAQYDRDSAVLAGEHAQQIYDETISGLSSTLERAREELEEAQEQIAEYQSYVNDDSYRTYFKVDELQALYDENLKVLQDTMEDWDVSWPQVTGQGGGAAQGSGGASSDQVQVLSSLYKVLEENLKEVEQAQSDYEDAITNAAFELQTLELKLPSLQQAVTEAQKSYETQILEAKLTYETALANAERAESDYETATEKAESDYETLKSDYEDAVENLELFESSVGDGFFYAPGNGTILRMMVREEQTITSDSILFVYSNPEEISVTVSVDQADIASITLGDSAYIQSTGHGGFDGVVTQVNPVSSSDSRTSVTYDVTITLSGEVGELGTNESVTVIFGEENIEALKEMMNHTGPDSAGDVEGTPEGTQDEGSAPEGMPEGTSGEGAAPEGMPEGAQGEGSAPEGMPERTQGERSDRGNGTGMDNNGQKNRTDDSTTVAE